MRKIIASVHVSTDGFVAGPNGEMDWIKIDDKMFDLVGKFTDEADTALYGRITYNMMDSYWPTAADKPNAGKHDIEHSAWYNKVNKVVVSNSLRDKNTNKTSFINGDVPAEIKKLKAGPGGNILIFGSPSVIRLLSLHGLIDNYWLFINPVILGRGIPLFPDNPQKINLNLLTTKVFSCGVTGLHYEVAK